MTKIYGEELRRVVITRKERLLECIKERAERISDSKSDIDDCFMSQRVEENGICECDMQLGILDGDGMMEYDAIFDNDGNEVCLRTVNTRYGLKVVGNGIFANSKKALLKKTGWHEETIRVPAWTKFVSSGSGLMGVYSGSYQVVRWHTNMVTGEYYGFPD